ncbi:YraN family protein [Elusimicrobiota bacterium]
MQTAKTKGKIGEDLAVKFLTQTNPKIRIIERNWKCFLGEMDIIAKEDNILCFIEVKSRRLELDQAHEAITRKKELRLKQLAYAYLKSKNLPLETQIAFHVVCVDITRQEYRLIKDAFMFSVSM